MAAAGARAARLATALSPARLPPAVVAAVLVLAGPLLACGAASAATEFRSVGVAAAVVHDGPSAQTRRIWLAPRGMPLEVLGTTPPWVRVRDISGDTGWVDRADLSPQRTVVARGQAPVRSAGQEGSEVLFAVERGVGLELLDPSPISGWVRVRHRNGASGWIRAADVWGL